MMMIRVHDHENQHRQLPLSQREEVDVGSGFSSRQQPFHHSTATTPPSAYTAFKSPAMETSSTVRFPFTNAQWKELERQAMIYKYMVASVPVPLDLLLPITTSRNLSSSSSPLVGELKLRHSKGTADPEPGRCKRTDGKKWRCSRGVAPDQKYCERHMHRGRPRSRKHVELHVNNSNNNSNNNNKRARLGHTNNNNNNNNGLATTLASCNSSQTSHFLGDSNTLRPYHPSPVFEPLPSLLSSDKEPRSLEWIPMAAGAAASDDPTRLHLMHQPKLEMTSKPSSMFTQEEPFLNLNSYANFTTTTTGEAENDKDCSLILNPDDVVSQTQETNHHGKKLSPWWLSPTPPPSFCWAGSPLGGPLAEVLRPSAASDPPSPFTGNGDSGSPPATVVSSLSGVLQKTLNAASLSDSSGCSSSSPALGSSNCKPEISLL